MTPPDRHGSPLKIMMGCEKKNLGLPNSERAGAPSSSCGRQPQARGAPRFLCHHSVILVGKKKSPPLLPFFFLLFPRPPVFPLFQLRCVPAWAHRRGFPALLADVKLERNESLRRSLRNISSVAVRKRRARFVEGRRVRACVRACFSVCGSIVVKGRPMVSQADGWEAQRRRRDGEKPTWMRRQSGWRGGEIERQGCPVMDYCNALQWRYNATESSLSYR